MKDEAHLHLVNDVVQGDLLRRLPLQPLPNVSLLPRGLLLGLGRRRRGRRRVRTSRGRRRGIVLYSHAVAAVAALALVVVVHATATVPSQSLCTQLFFWNVPPTLCFFAANAESPAVGSINNTEARPFSILAAASQNVARTVALETSR